jgi:hypothetical protein
MRTLAFAIVIVMGCGTEPPTDTSTDFPYPEIPAEPQRPGDPAKGYDYLLNGGYITCGIPRSIAPSGAINDRMAGRTGDNANLAYYFSAATSQEGVRVVNANCMFCHAGRINGQLVIGLGAADRDFTTDQVALLDVAMGLVSDSKELAVLQRFRDRAAAIARPRSSRGRDRRRSVSTRRTASPRRCSRIAIRKRSRGRTSRCCRCRPKSWFPSTRRRGGA